MPLIHPTALIDPACNLAPDVAIGPYAILEGAVVLGRGCVVEAHAQLIGDVVVGEDCIIGRGAVIGDLPQDIGFDPATPSGVRIGSRNRLREHITIHRGSKPGAMTAIGNDNLLMVGVHLGHDCVFGDRNIIANNCLFGGHVWVGSGNVVGGMTAFHQSIRVGDSVMAHGMSKFSKDVPSFCMVAHFNKVIGLNVISLRRLGLSAEARAEIKRAFNLFYRSGLGFRDALARAREQSWSAEAQGFLDFVGAPSRRGVCSYLRASASANQEE